MQFAIDLPSPSPADSETVITALETAAVFCSKGDGREAMRWLRRAAESAGEAGDDQRALALSRSVAELHDELDADRERARSPSLPPPPPPPPLSLRPSYPLPPSARTSRTPQTPSVGPRSSRPRSESARPLPPAMPRAPSVGARNAARVAVAPSATDPYVFELRLLADGEAPRAGSDEGLLVMLDPKSTLLHG